VRSFGNMWVATLGEIVSWWKSRNEAHVGVRAVGDGLWHVAVDGPDRLVTSFRDQTVAGSRSMVCTGLQRPTVHCGPQWPEGVVQRLRDGGYTVERSSDIATSCAVDLDVALPIQATADNALRLVQVNDAGLVRMQPWPSGYQSCFSPPTKSDASRALDAVMRLPELGRP